MEICSPFGGCEILSMKNFQTSPSQTITAAMMQMYGHQRHFILKVVIAIRPFKRDWPVGLK